ncbi:MAG: hypothetical protein VZR02_03280 [Lachnospiraceae bacterium]|nr:hypothetical protein [Lachnospiraceae bacterium]
MRRREYIFKKAVDEEQKEAILGEGRALDGMDEMNISEDGKSMVVTCSEDLYSELMTRLVNIVARLTGGDSFSFSKFLYED